MLPVGLLVNILIIMVPSQWSINSLAFILAMVYYMYKINSHYDKLPVPLICSVWLGIVYYSFAAWILFLKMRNLYKLLLQNQKLNREMKRLLQIFPESVIIRFMSSQKHDPEISPEGPIFQNSSCFTNEEFTNHICNVEKSISKPFRSY